LVENRNLVALSGRLALVLCGFVGATRLTGLEVWSGGFAFL
jgi:hypothetical protein